MPEITIIENNIDDAAKILATITEFEDVFPKEKLVRELEGAKSLVIVAYADEKPAGCVISFDRFNDGSFYCWLVAVDANYRGLGLMPKMMEYQEKWLKDNNYKLLRIKTRNDSPVMLAYLIKQKFNIVDVASPRISRRFFQRAFNSVLLRAIDFFSRFLKFEYSDPVKNRIMLEKRL